MRWGHGAGLQRRDMRRRLSRLERKLSRHGGEAALHGIWRRARRLAQLLRARTPRCRADARRPVIRRIVEAEGAGEIGSGALARRQRRTQPVKLAPGRWTRGVV